MLDLPTKTELLELLPYLSEQERAELDSLIEEIPPDTFLDPDPVRWIQQHFYIPETRSPLRFEPYQELALREALAQDGDLFRYSVILWSDVKKSAKSTIAAAVALWRAWQVEWGQVVIVANDLKQADSRVGFYIRRAIELHPQMRHACKIVRNRIDLPNRTFLESVPIDPTGEAGGNADMVVYSELWGAHEIAKQRMWTETTLPPGKFGKAFRWIETYAGFSGESVLLEQLYDQGVKHGRPMDPDLPIYANDSARMFAMWNTQGRMPWHTPAYYAQEEAVLLPNEFRRIHKNEWVSSQGVFVPLEWWDACKDPEILPAALDEVWIVALDAGVSNDNFGMIAVSRHPAKETDSVVRYARKWVPPKGGKIDFQGTPEDPGPELELRRLIDSRNVIEVAYDPMQLEDMAGRLRKEGLAWFRPFPQAKDRLIADSRLRQMILEKRVHHSGEPDLREHVGNANAEIDPEERKIRIVKRSDLLKVDLAVALSMGNAECMRLNL